MDMKRILCLIISLVLILGLLPMAAGAASDEIDEVSISGLEHPIAGQKLDTTYKIPARGTHYEKDEDYEEVVWYDRGKNGNEGETALKEGDRAEEGHTYVAELHLIADSKYSFRTRSIDVELSEDMLCRIDDVETQVISNDSDNDSVTILLFYQADYLYDRKNPVNLTFEEGADGTVKAGEYPWTASAFGGAPRGHFDLTVTWYRGKQDIERNEMDEDDRFEAGQTYTLKVELDSSRSSKHASFDPDMDIILNGEKGDTWVGNDIGFEAYALFQFTASEGIDKIAIKGIEGPQIGGSRQRSGFICSTENVDVEYNRWEVVTSAGTTKEFRGDFEADQEYLLYLDLIPDSGFSLSDLKKSSITVNKGKIDSVYFDDDGDVWTVVISFEMDDLQLTGIEVTTPPRKTEYVIGEDFQPRGMVVTATYNAAHTEKLAAEDFEFYPSEDLDKEDTVITISYKEGRVTKEAELNITVIDEDLTLTGIVITAKPKKTAYKSGETFDPTGLVVTAVYDDKSTAEVTDLEFIPGDKLTVEDDTIIIRYTEGRKSVTTEIDIRVTQAEKLLSELVLTEEPDKTEYYEGEYFDPTGMVLTALYEDKSSAVVTDYTYKPSRALRIEDESVLIVYYEDRYTQTVEVKITVKENTRKLASLKITETPYKTVYTEGETFDPAGMEVTAIYDDKTTSILSKYSISPSDKLTPDTKEITVEYTEGDITRIAFLPITVKPALVNPFTDVKDNDYFYEAVLWAFYHEPQVTNGMTDTEFSPATTCTRGQVVTFLWRAAGCPTPASEVNPFIDVADNSWYRDAVLWAVEKGITNGTGADTFSPSTTCSLAHVITFLYRAAGEPGKSAAPETWYADAMNWAFDNGLFRNLTLSEIQPNSDCARRDIVNFLYLQLG